MSSRAILAAAGIALLVGAAAVALYPRMALAAGLGPGHPARTMSPQEEHHCGDPEARAARLARIAGLLGMSVEELRAALDEGRTLLDLARERGIDPAELRGRLGHRLSDEKLAPLAERLGLTVEELRAELEGGKTLAEIAQERGVSLEELRDLLPHRGGPGRWHGRGPGRHFREPAGP